MMDLVLLYPLPATMAVIGIFLLLADARTARREKMVPVRIRGRRKHF